MFKLFKFFQMSADLKVQGRYWQLVLCIFLTIVSLVYSSLHLNFEADGIMESGSEYVRLGEEQLVFLETFIYPSHDSLLLDSNREAFLAIRNKSLIRFLENEYGKSILDDQLLRIEGNLQNIPNNQVLTYLKSLRLKVRSFFFLTGTGVYLEALFWSLFGVLVSLIYFVSLSTTNRIASSPNEELENFDASEIASHIAKMFYAPLCTLVLVLGYHYLSASGDVTADITVNKGLVLFSFISGFYSGRVMKLLNKIKEIILPFGDSRTSAIPRHERQFITRNIVPDRKEILVIENPNKDKDWVYAIDRLFEIFDNKKK